jgi:hypothetical protein
MVDAFAFLIWRSTWNSIRTRVKRLRQPRYAIATAAGVLYFTLVFGRQAANGIAMFGITRDIVDVVVPLVVALLMAGVWLWPGTPTPALGFTSTDVQLLFPAPISRTQLIAYRVVRTHLTNLWAAALLTLMSRPSGVGLFFTTLIGVWLVLSVMGLHQMGASLTSVLRWLPRVLFAAIGLAVGVAVARHWSTLLAVSDLASGIATIKSVIFTGVSGVLLWPFVALVRLPTSSSALAFASALPAVLAMWAACVWWVIKSDAAFEEASATQAERVSKALSTRGMVVPRATARRAPLFALAPTGRVEVALLWKNLIVAGRVSKMMLFMLATWSVTIGVVISMKEESFQFGRLVAILGMGLAGMVTFTGPMMATYDLRQDLARLAIIKTWPIPGATIVRGEVLAPILVLSGIVALALMTAAAFGNAWAAQTFEVSRGVVVMWAASLILVLTGIIASQVVMQNGIAVMFPAWIRVNPKSAGSVDMMGQQMLMMFGSMVLIPLAAIPATLVSSLVWFALKFTLGTAPIIVPAVAATLVLLAQCWLVAHLIGAILDRTDISATEPG